MELVDKRRAIHQKIRKQQIQHLFQKQRYAMQHPSQFARQQLTEAIHHIKMIVEEEGEQPNLSPWLRQYQEIAQKFIIGEFLFSSVMFNHKLAIVRQGIFPVQCSIAELFILLLNNTQDLTTINELLAILEVNMYQSRLYAGTHLDQIKDILKMTINTLPLKMFENNHIWLNFLRLLGQIMLCVRLMDCEQFLNEKQKEILLLLEGIGSNQLFLLDGQNRYVYIEVCLFVLTIVHETQKFKSETSVIIETLQKLTINNLQENSDSLGRNCQYLRRMWMSGVQVRTQCLHYFQKYLEKSIDEREFAYFQMINTLLCFNPQPISQQMFEAILLLILKEPSNIFKEEQTLQTKKWMILILKRHFSLEQGYWNQSQLQSFSIILQQNIDTFPQILTQLHKYSEQILQAFTSLVCSTINQLSRQNQLSTMLGQYMVSIPKIKTISFYHKINEVQPDT